MIWRHIRVRQNVFNLFFSLLWYDWYCIFVYICLLFTGVMNNFVVVVFIFCISFVYCYVIHACAWLCNYNAPKDSTIYMTVKNKKQQYLSLLFDTVVVYTVIIIHQSIALFIWLQKIKRTSAKDTPSQVSKKGWTDA